MVANIYSDAAFRNTTNMGIGVALIEVDGNKIPFVTQYKVPTPHDAEIVTIYRAVRFVISQYPVSFINITTDCKGVSEELMGQHFTNKRLISKINTLKSLFKQHGIFYSCTWVPAHCADTPLYMWWADFYARKLNYDRETKEAITKANHNKGQHR